MYTLARTPTHSMTCTLSCTNITRRTLTTFSHTCMRVRTLICTFKHFKTQTRIHKQMTVSAFTHIYTNTRIYTNAYVRIHILMHTHTYTRTHTDTHTYTNTHTHAHTVINILARTYVYINKQ